MNVSAQKAVDIMRGKAGDRHEGYMAVLFLCWTKRARILGQEDSTSDLGQFYESLLSTVAESGSDRCVAHLMRDVWEQLKSADVSPETLMQTYNSLPDSVDELSAIIEDFELERASGPQSACEMTPRGISDLAIEILDLMDGEHVADFGTGTGSFLIDATRKARCSLLYGCDIATKEIALAKARAQFISANIVIEQANMFHIDEVFDKCFFNYPFGMKGRRFKEDALECLSRMGFGNLPRIASSDWLFNLGLVAKTKEGGRAVGVMTAGAAFNGSDERIRRHFVENGWVEAVIALPIGMFPNASVATCMVVLSYNNESVRLVDASTLCQRGRRTATFDNSDIKRIAELLKADEEGLSCSMTSHELSKEQYILDPKRYLSQKVLVQNGVPFESLIEKVTRGSGWSKRRLEECNSNIPTKFRYLMLQNINDGEVDEDLPFLKEVDPSQERYCVQDGDLLLSKVGPMFKVAVARVAEGEKILATGNLYIIRLDRSKVDSRYAKLYLEGSQGAAQLRRTTVGTAVVSLPVSAFSEILIPLVSLEDQREIVEKYEAIRQEISMHRMAIERAQQRIAGLLGDR